MKRTLCAVLSCLAILPLLAACGEAEMPSGTPSAAETTASAAVETTAETTAPEYVAPSKGFDGQEFIFSSYLPDSTSWSVRKYSECGVTEQNGDAINDAIYTRNLTVEEALDVKITAKSYNQLSLMTKATLAGDRYADAVLMTGSEQMSCVNSHLLVDMYELDTLDLTHSWWNQNCRENFAISGRIYGMAGDISPMGLMGFHCVYVNKQLLIDFNLPSIYDKVREGAWTLDSMREYGTAVASDLNGDGVMTEADRFGLESEAIGMARMLASGVTVTARDEKGNPYLSIDQDNAAAAVEKIVALFRDKDITIYSSDYSNKGYASVFRDLLFQMFIDDRILFINNWLVWTLDLRLMESDFGVLPPPKQDEAQENYIVGSTEGWTTYVTVPVTTADYELDGYLLDALGYYGQKFVEPALMETTVTNKALRDDDSLEMLDIISASTYYEPAGLYNWGGISGLFNGFIANNNTAWASTYAANEAKIIAAIEKTVAEFSE